MNIATIKFTFIASSILIASLLSACQINAPIRPNNNLIVDIDRSDEYYFNEAKRFWRVHIRSGESGVVEAIKGCYLSPAKTTSIQDMHHCLVLDVTLTNFSLSFGKAAAEKFGRDAQIVTTAFTRKDAMQERAYQVFKNYEIDKQTINNEVDFISKKISPVFANAYKEVEAELDYDAPRKPSVTDEKFDFDQELLSSLPYQTRKEVAYQLLLSKISNARPDDYTTAVQLSRMAADDGSYTAQFNMGVYYQQGFGVLQDNKEAFSWFMKSAEQGYPMAFASLAGFYIVGNEVEESQPVAYALLSVAASFAKSSKDDIDTIRRLRDQVAMRLSPREISSAQSLSKDMVKKNNVEISIKAFIARRPN